MVVVDGWFNFHGRSRSCPLYTVHFTGLIFTVAFCKTTKIGPLERFLLHGSTVNLEIFAMKYFQP
jgi:hypothetical protein